MQLRALWPNDPIFIELGLKDAALASGLRAAGYTKYLGISTNADRIARMQQENPSLTDSFTCSNRKRPVLHNN
ncbi:MAG TPA: hypothetical protein VGJ15_05870, partial [Pirellulales bacterium]